MDKKIKKITLNNIAKSIEELARMTAKGFENAASKQDIETLQNDVSDIKLRSDNLAAKFEVRDLEKRVRRLEVKTGIRQEV